MIRFGRPVDSCQAREADFLFDQEAVRLSLVAFANEMRRCDRFSKCIHALEVFAVMRHYLASAPQIIQRQRAVLTTSVALRSRPCHHFKVAVGHGATLAQDSPNFGDSSSMIPSHPLNSRVARVAIALSAHDHAPVRQFVHWADGKPASPVKELALFVGYLFPHPRCVIEYPTVKLDILAASDDL